MERITAAAVASIVGVPVRFTKLEVGLRLDGIQITRVFGEAPSIGRTFVVTAHVSRNATDFTVTLSGDATDAGVLPPADASADARADTGVAIPPPGSQTPDSGTPPCDGPRYCPGLPDDDPICRSGGPGGLGVTESGRIIRSSPLSSGASNCEAETAPLGFPIGYGTYSCGLSTNAIVLTAEGLYATCDCMID